MCVCAKLVLMVVRRGDSSDGAARTGASVVPGCSVLPIMAEDWVFEELA